MASPDSGLVRRMRRGDVEAFDELVERFQGPLLGYVTGMSGDPAAAEDIVQDVFLKLLRGLDGYRERGKLRSYLFSMARHATLDLLRRRSSLPLDDLGGGAEPAAGTSPLEAAEQAEAGRRLRAALARLPDSQREVILMHHFAGLTFAAIARVIGVPLGTALARAHYGLRRLRGYLAEASEGEP